MGKVIPFNHLNPRKRTIFALVPARKSGKLQDISISQPKDKKAVELVKMGDNDKLKEVEET